MKSFEKEEMIILTECLLKQITQVLDSRGTVINGELRSKLSYAELNLFKISKLLKNDK
jgi:hypothetical protein